MRWDEIVYDRMRQALVKETRQDMDTKINNI